MSENKSAKLSYRYVIISTLIILIVLMINHFCFHCYITKIEHDSKVYYEKNIKILEGLTFNLGKEIVSLNVDTQSVQDSYVKDFQEFKIEYYTHQSDWLNRWLTILGALITFVGIFTPLLFMKHYADKKDDLDKLIDKAQNTSSKLEDMYLKISLAHQDVADSARRVADYLGMIEEAKDELKNDIKNQQDIMQKEMKEIKEYVQKAKESENRAKVSQLLSAAYRQYLSNQYDNAIRLFQQTLDIVPDNIEALNNLGICYVELKEYDKALLAFQKALAISKDVETTYNYIEALIFASKFTEALETLTLFLEMNPLIFDDDKPRWLAKLTENKESESVQKILELIEKLPVRKRSKNTGGYSFREIR